MGGGRTTKGGLTRATLVHAAVKLATQGGLNAVTYHAVARASDLTTGAVQGHFPSIDALRAAVVVAWSEELRDRAVRPGETESGLRRVWRMCEDWIVQADLLRIPFELIPAGQTEDAKALYATLDAWCLRLQRGLRQAVLRQELTEAADLAVLGHTLHAVLVAMAWTPVTLGIDEAAATLATAAHSLLWQAATAQGHAELPTGAEAVDRVRARLERRRLSIQSYGSGLTALADASLNPEAADDLDVQAKAVMQQWVAEAAARRRLPPSEPTPPEQLADPNLSPMARSYYEEIYAGDRARYEESLRMWEAARAAERNRDAARPTEASTENK